MAAKLNKFEQILVDLFTSMGNKPLSYNEIVVNGAVVKKEKQSIKAAITSLMEKKVLVKQNRKFLLTEKPSVPEPRLEVKNLKSSSLIEGVFDATPMAKDLTYAFVRTPEGDYFVSSEDTLNAYHNDTVSLEPQLSKSGKKYGIIRKIVSRANVKQTGDIRNVGSHQVFISTNRKIHKWFDLSGSLDNLEGKKVLVEVTNWGNPLSGKAPVVEVLEVLGNAGDPEIELLAVIKQYDLPLSFPDSVLVEVNSLSDKLPSEVLSSRTDHRDLFTFTIDPVTAKDFDDAISITATSEGWTLFVHIADVAHYVRIGTATYNEALVRGNSFYFPKMVIPMLPERLSNKICSLRPNEEKLTLTVKTGFDLKGKITHQSLYESIIISDHRLSYEEVDSYIEGTSGLETPQLSSAIDMSRALSKLLSQKRKHDGYLFFDLPEVEYHYDEEGFIREFTLSEETESHRLIENFMLVANEFVATKLSALSPTSLYRIHEDPDWNKIERLIKILTPYGIKFNILENTNKSMQDLLERLPGVAFHKVFDRMVLRSLKKAKYSTEHVRHFGLSIDNYTHFTSPIRRICDLVIHMLCKVYIIGSGSLNLSQMDLVKVAQIATDRELLADESEREINRVYKLSYMKTHVGEQYTGLVIGANSSGLIIQLDEIPITGVLDKSQFSGKGYVYLDQEQRYINKRTGYYYQLTDKVLVTVMQVTDDVYFELSQEADSHTHDPYFLTVSSSTSHKHQSHKEQKHGMQKRIDQKSNRQNMDKQSTKNRRK